ncbi:hypothetical protein GCM10010406_07730 [Streptomyces thermolineatus]|uniref:Lipoprotein n=2 Tax=Streptomyces thermolineatus TaxID=44033 RepID=A0ABN3KXR3_9ACTN
MAALIGAGGCDSGGTYSGARGRDNFDQDDVQAVVVECAGRGRPAATVKVTVADENRKYFVGVKFLDSEGKVLDQASRKLTPEGDASDGGISGNVEIPMNEPEAAGRVASCRLSEAF